MDKLIIFSDVHLHNWPYGASYTAGWNTRLLAQNKALNDMLSYAIQHDIKHIAFLGDFFHTHEMVHANALRICNLFVDRVVANGIEMISLVGNHDMATSRGEVHTIDLLGRCGPIVDEERILQWEGRTFHCLPYMGTMDAKQHIPQFLKRCNPDSVVLMHQGVANVALNSKGFILKDEVLDVQNIPNDIFHAFVGHYHSFKHVSDKVTIPGSLMQHTWADVKESRGFLVVEFEPKKITHVPVLAPEFQILDMCGTSALTHKDCDDIEGIDNNYLRVKNFAPETDLNALREVLSAGGANSVEFELATPDTLVEDPGETAQFDLPQIVESFMEVNELDKELCEVGKRVMRGHSPDVLD